ncbi:MAG: RagB/SusD family nutrient uptake outer membrane protein [Bacteroidales bacterium]|nr:RagB/SusD family nutrient uptake outer membrane protein [Bacteroidales bacterium]
MKKYNYISVIAILVLLTGSVSCSKWLDVRSSDEIIESEAFKETEGFRTALIGIYRQVASPDLWGRELSWGLTSNLANNFVYASSDPAYRPALNATADPYVNSTIRVHIDAVWAKAYNTIANINELLDKIESRDPSEFEVSFEKDVIMGEARGLRGLLHFTLLSLYRPAPVTGYNGEALPYVTTYPDYQPVTKQWNEYVKLMLDDIKESEKLLYHYDVEEGRNGAVFQFGANNMQNMDYYLYQNAGAWRNDGAVRDNAHDAFGFFATRGYRYNWWSANALLARVYSYLRDFDNAEKYADVILDNWVNANNFFLDTSTADPAGNPNLLDAKRRPEQLLAFYNKNVSANWKSAALTSYYKTQNPATLYDDKNDYRLTRLLTAVSGTNVFSRVWEPTAAGYSTNTNVEKHSRNLIPVIELPEMYFIKAECLAQKGNIEDALKEVKKVRDARQCLVVKTAADLTSFTDQLVLEAEREFFARGTAFQFLKKLNYPTVYNGAAVRKTLIDGWYVLPIPDAETNF